MGLMRISGAARGDIMLKDIVPPGALLAETGCWAVNPRGFPRHTKSQVIRLQHQGQVLSFHQLQETHPFQTLSELEEQVFIALAC